MTDEQIINASQVAVASIVADLTDRRGLRQEFDSIDDIIQKEIIQEWTDLVSMAIKGEVNKL